MRTATGGRFWTPVDAGSILQRGGAEPTHHPLAVLDLFFGLQTFEPDPFGINQFFRWHLAASYHSWVPFLPSKRVFRCDGSQEQRGKTSPRSEVCVKDRPVKFLSTKNRGNKKSKKH